MLTSKRDSIELFQSSALYADRRLQNLDAVTLLEVIEHIDEPRLDALERAIFGFARPRVVVVSTPNSEYNARFPNLGQGEYRHPDHRFEWTRAQFENWCTSVRDRFGYLPTFGAIGDTDSAVGSPTQMAVFQCA